MASVGLLLLCLPSCITLRVSAQRPQLEQSLLSVVMLGTTILSNGVKSYEAKLAQDGAPAAADFAAAFLLANEAATLQSQAPRKRRKTALEQLQG